MINAKIFISHSAKTEVVMGHLDAIQLALESAGWIVRLDKSGLDVGDGWRSRLFQWMDEVHAAVLILSRSAMKSKFVPIELSVLSFRHIREQNFLLLPVLISDLELETLAEGMVGELRLTEIQFLTANDPLETAQAVVRRLGEQCQTLGRLRTPLEVLEQDAADLLKNAGFSDTQLLEAVYATPEFAPLNQPEFSRIHEAFARLLLRAESGVASRVLVALSERRTSLAARRCLLELLDIVAPFWVSESNSAKLARCALAACNQRSFLLACREPWTARAHICRSSMKPLGSGWQVCEIPPPECEDHVQWIWQQLARALTPPGGARRQMGIDGVRRRLERLESNRQPLFLLFPPEWVPSQSLLGRLRQEFPTLTVFAIGRSEDLESLRPCVSEFQSTSEEQEFNVCDTYDETKVRLMPSPQMTW